MSEAAEDITTGNGTGVHGDEFPIQHKRAVQDLFENWWWHATNTYGESYGLQAREMATRIPAQARMYHDVLKVKYTKDMKKAVRKGSL